MTLKQAEKAVNDSTGCPGCGGSDIDMKVEMAPPVDKRRRPARAARPAPEKERTGTTGRLRNLPLDRIYANPDQPRKVFNVSELEELAASIKTHGLLQAIRVRPDGTGRYMIIAGERRYRAHVLAGLTTISALVDDVDDGTVMEQSIVENLQRVDITPLEEARAFQTALEMSVGCHIVPGDEVALAQRLGLKQPWRITERLSLLNLREDHQELLARGILSPLPGVRDVAAPSASTGRATEAHPAGHLRQLRQAAGHHRGAPATGDPRRAPAACGPRDRRGARGPLRPRASRREAVRAAGPELRQQADGIVKKIAPHRAGVVADQIKLITKHLGKMEKALRSSAVSMVQVEAAA